MENKFRVHCYLFGAITIALSTGTIRGYDALSAPSKHVRVDREFTNQPIPKWQNGFFIARELFRPILFIFNEQGSKIFNEQGSKIREVQITIPGAGRVNLTDAAIAPNGKMAVSGAAISIEGAPAAFIAWLNQAGVIEQIVRTSPFAAYRLCFTEESLWALGWELPPTGERQQLHNILRRYNAAGRLRNSSLSTESIGGLDSGHPSAGGHLISSGTRVGGGNRCAVRRHSRKMAGRWTECCHHWSWVPAFRRRVP
jgi:hypothetical protein